MYDNKEILFPMVKILKEERLSCFTVDRNLVLIRYKTENNFSVLKFNIDNVSDICNAVFRCEHNGLACNKFQFFFWIQIGRMEMRKLKYFVYKFIIDNRIVNVLEIFCSCGYFFYRAFLKRKSILFSYLNMLIVCY